MNATPSSPAPQRPVYRWIPVRSLGPHHRPRIASHLLQLDERDRYLRFGYRPSDERILQYVHDLDFSRDELFGIFNRQLELTAMAHLAYAPRGAAGTEPVAEFAVSVRAQSRGRGYGARLFDRAVMHARNHGIRRLIIHALSENAAMLSIARKAGATVERHGSESEACLALPPDNWSSRLEEALEIQAAELHHRLKVQAHILDQWWDALVDADPPGSGPAASAALDCAIPPKETSGRPRVP